MFGEYHHLLRNPGGHKHPKVLLKKRNWRAPELDRQVNYWWKCATALSEDVTTAFWSISMIEDPYPTWFSEGEKQG